ncbi:hypothetical protein [Alkaliphilus transvaalensis]|uniref:hypothetical protein n=1 Tax=Alkaliphilus transvaalensis TaxID=114628 RepID=UPI000479C675|nr:hypothetical protein [Alkaliphilus transvaalensis]
MKRNRMMIKRKRRNTSLLLVVVFCIILPITAIYIGLRITELWVSPVLNSDDYISVIDIDNNEDEPVKDDSEEVEDPNKNANENVNENTSKISNEIRPFSIYTIQIASLVDNSNLDDVIGELNYQRLPHLIYQLDNSYKVYVLGGTKREHVEIELARVKENYPDAYINEVHASRRSVQYEEGENKDVLKEIVGDLNEILITLEEQGETWYNFFKKEGKLDGYIELLKKQQTLLSHLSNIISEVELPESFPDKALIDKMIVYQEGNINRSVEFYQEDLEDNIHRLHSLYLDNLFRIVEIIKG